MLWHETSQELTYVSCCYLSCPSQVWYEAVSGGRYQHADINLASAASAAGYSFLLSVSSLMQRKLI